MIFVDSNIPMYLVGAPHVHKAEAQILVERAIAARQRLVADAEVMQEILHRYSAIGRKDAIAEAIGVLLRIVDEVFPVEERDALRAAEVLRLTEGISARDAIHIAIMERRGVRRIMSFDGGFDRWPGVTRLGSP